MDRPAPWKQRPVEGAAPPSGCPEVLVSAKEAFLHQGKLWPRQKRHSPRAIGAGCQGTAEVGPEPGHPQHFWTLSSVGRAQGRGYIRPQNLYIRG